MTIHIDHDREENKIRFLLASQTKMIRTLNKVTTKMHFQNQEYYEFCGNLRRCLLRKRCRGGFGLLKTIETYK